MSDSSRFCVYVPIITVYTIFFAFINNKNDLGYKDIRKNRTSQPEQQVEKSDFSVGIE